MYFWQSALRGLSAVVEDSLCNAEQRPKAQKVCGEEDTEEGDSGDEGETSEPKVNTRSSAFTMSYLMKALIVIDSFLSFSSKYHTGPWSGCSALCGDGGVRKREVTCFKKDNGTVVALEKSE